MISATPKLSVLRTQTNTLFMLWQRHNIALVRGFSSATIPEIDSDALVEQLDAKTPGLLVLDELAAGTINGFYNVPTPVFKQADTGPLDRAIHERIKHAKEVVVHCLFCSPGKRGPTAAAALQQRLQALGIEPAPRVSILKGGIDAFMSNAVKPKFTGRCAVRQQSCNMGALLPSNSRGRVGAPLGASRWGPALKGSPPYPSMPHTSSAATSSVSPPEPAKPSTQPPASSSPLNRAENPKPPTHLDTEHTIQSALPIPPRNPK
ncbi:hypothetical protein VOLCADRAFT_98123 [Volvox carteri f. nagariensis]|uniref:Rhodanese domain-containing protein n=1 Tax=Volvox carteri f. nagariensis TaxID=3068 RepID=D8UEI1_VOLCA|nr:uncharacterized protein VOLCADRAFT_98123 [Volvox carteri f. nagariensis]EFJ41886.1 hypothetical protein VOLCADRAFT_98123 [Volvox carteri f. nagariensis]|eukprot:XP_002957084.1 hypothetical protein VOLCADRAFT_98123 [Volvox carteri f. nagariensis]